MSEGYERGSAANGVWKWIAGILLAVLIAGSPGIVQAIKAPSQEEVDFIRERQVQVLIWLSAIEAKLESNAERLDNIQRQLEEHENEQGGK